MSGEPMMIVERRAIERAAWLFQFIEEGVTQCEEAVGLMVHFDHLLKDQEHQDPGWWRSVIAEEMGVDAPPGDGVNPLRDWLRELKHMKAIRRVPSHFAIERQGSFFSYIDVALGPYACKWGPLSEVHAFPSEREAREVMKICPPDSRVVPAVVELVEP